MPNIPNRLTAAPGLSQGRNETITMGRYSTKGEPSFVVRNFRKLDDGVAIAPRDMQIIAHMSNATFWRKAKTDPNFPKLRSIGGTRRRCTTVGEFRGYLQRYGVGE